MATLVIAALSARLLAQSARRAGWSVMALDLFGDVDTRGAASTWHAIGDPAVMRIDAECFLAALASAAACTDCVGWIAGAGFEPRPDLLETGARILPLLGNTRASVGRVRDAQHFFATLDALKILHPETRFDPPADPAGWLVKNFAASGGWHIRRAAAAHVGAREPGSYFQREMAGRPMSVLFAAAGDRAHVIGINDLLVGAHGARPYVYRGAIGPVTDLSSSLQKALSNLADALACAFGLRGLASLDFLLEGETVRVLEINPRPSASMALYDADTPAGLVQVHIDACAGRLPPAPRVTGLRALARGERIVYATRDSGMAQPAVDQLLALGCHDVPQPGSRIAAGAPLCSVSAHGNSASAVRIELARREAAVLSMVQNRNEAPDETRHAN